MFGFIKKIFKRKNKDTNFKNECQYKEEILKRKIEELKQHIRIVNNFPVDALAEILLSKNNEIEKIDKQVQKLDLSKKTLLLIDDDSGIISLLNDIIKFSKMSQKINIINIKSSYAGFLYFYLTKKYNIKIDYAIIDITYGGKLQINNTNVSIEGISVFADLITKNPDLKFLFYTGNSLNEYILSSEKIIVFFNELTGNNIEKYAIHKNEYPPSKMLEIIKQVFKE